MTAVVVPSPLSAKMMPSAAWLTGCDWLQKNPPQAAAGAENRAAALSTVATNAHRLNVTITELLDGRDSAARSHLAPNATRLLAYFAGERAGRKRSAESPTAVSGARLRRRAGEPSRF